MDIVDFTQGSSGEQELGSVAGDRRDCAVGDRWRRRLAYATAAAGVYLAVRRVRRRRDDSDFVRIEIEGASPSMDR